MAVKPDNIKAINLSPRWAGIPLLKRWIPSLTRRWRQWRGQDWHLSQRGGILWLGCYPSNGFRFVTLLRSGSVEDRQRQKFNDLIIRTKADMFLDIGAFIGVYALTIRKQFPQLEVHAFEPHPVNYAVLTANALLNGWLDQMHLHPFGLGDKDERTNMIGAGQTASIAQPSNPEVFQQRYDHITSSATGNAPPRNSPARLPTQNGGKWNCGGWTRCFLTRAA